LFLTDDEWDMRGKNHEQKNAPASMQEVTAWAEVGGMAVGMMAHYWVGH
jgi:hypothetical protein